MAKKYDKIGAWVATAGNQRTFQFVRARFAQENSIFVVQNEDGSESLFPVRFNARDYFFGDMFRAVLDFDTMTVTAMPVALTYADAIRDTGVSALAQASVTRASAAIKGLQELTINVSGSLKTGAIPATMFAEIERAEREWGNLPAPGAQGVNAIRQARVNLVNPQIIYPVRLQVGDRQVKLQSRVDSGSEVSIISPAMARKLRAPEKGAVQLGGFTGGSAVVPMVELKAVIGKQKVIPVTAAVSNLVTLQTGRDFLVGADLLLAAKKAGVSML